MVYQRFKMHLLDLARLVSGLYPSKCVLCAGVGMPRVDLCRSCLQCLPIIERACLKCGVPLSVECGRSVCGRCIKQPSCVDASFALCVYQEPVNWLVQSLKYQGYFPNARVLAALWLNNFSTRLVPMPELIVPVPLHVQRLKQRGFNQAMEFAVPIARALRVPLSYRHCERVVDTVQQTELPAQRRAANVRNAFVIKRPFNVKRIALCDDVVTTGSTVNELARLCKAQGVEHVQVWSMAKTSAFD